MMSINEYICYDENRRWYKNIENYDEYVRIYDENTEYWWCRIIEYWWYDENIEVYDEVYDDISLENIRYTIVAWCLSSSLSRSSNIWS